MVTTVDANFPNGWGGYVEAVEVISLEESGKHTIEIVPLDAESATILYVTALAVS